MASYSTIRNRPAASPRRRCPARRQRPAVRFRLEELEARHLPSGFGPYGIVPVPEVEGNDTLDVAQPLGDLNGTGLLAVTGRVGDGNGAGADVDWYQVTLTAAAQVHLSLGAATGSTFAGVLGLYNNDPWNFTDSEDLSGHRLLAQATGAPGGAADLDQTLAAGTYWVAVSGAGNRWFNPFLAGSGLPGSTGDYVLSLAADDLPAETNSVPALLASNPAPGATIARAPLVVRLDYSAPLDTGAIDLSSVQLVWSPTSDLGDPRAQMVALSTYNFSDTANELQLFPAAPLKPGYYGVFLPDGSTTPALRFHVTGIEGAGVSNDTPAAAYPLGVLTPLKATNVAAVLGDDPAYDPSSLDVLLANSAADVDLYSFTVTGPGRYAFTAEVFAGRIGSRLDPGVSLYRLDPADGQLRFIDGNDNTLNPTVSTNEMVPLYTDAALRLGLTAGTYYLAVSSSGNTPDPAAGTWPGQNGVFDPNASHSGANGTTVGPYVLNVSLRADNAPPRVVAITQAPGTTLTTSPTRLTVRFSESVNLDWLANQAFRQTSDLAVAPVFLTAPGAAVYYPRLESYDDATHEAVFLMLDRLPNGAYQLHLSGPRGLTDFAGNPVVGNSASGDFVTTFTVNGPSAPPLVWTDQEPNDDVLSPQDLGLFFAQELHAGVTAVRDFTGATSAAPADSADYYRFEVLQNRTYVFLLDGPDLPPGVGLSLFDAAGNPVPATIRDTGDGIQAQLAPGVYVVGVSLWDTGQAGAVAYRLRIGLGETGDNPPPLTVGPRPLSATSLVGVAPPAEPPPGVPHQPGTLSSQVETAVAAADLRAIAVAAAALLVSSPVSLTSAEGPPAPSGDALPRALRSGAPASLPASLLTALGAGTVGGVEEPGRPDAQLADARAESPEPRLTDDLLPPVAAGGAAEGSRVSPRRGEAAATPEVPAWFAALWEAWRKHPRVWGRSALNTTTEADAGAPGLAAQPEAMALSLPTGDSEAGAGTRENRAALIWVWAPAVACAVAAAVLHQRRAALVPSAPRLGEEQATGEGG